MDVLCGFLVFFCICFAFLAFRASDDDSKCCFDVDGTGDEVSIGVVDEESRRLLVDNSSICCFELCVFVIWFCFAAFRTSDVDGFGDEEWIDVAEVDSLRFFVTIFIGLNFCRGGVNGIGDCGGEEIGIIGESIGSCCSDTASVFKALIAYCNSSNFVVYVV